LLLGWFNGYRPAEGCELRLFLEFLGKALEFLRHETVGALIGGPAAVFGLAQQIFS
jgi:hypothetical protein